MTVEAEKSIPLVILKTDGEAAQTWFERRKSIQIQVVQLLWMKCVILRLKFL